MKIGAVLFDNPEDHSTGWACEASGSPFRIRTHGDLSSDTVWFTNLEFREMYDAGLLQHAFLRRNDFFRITMPQIMAELGLTEDHGVPISKATRSLADIFHRVMRITQWFLSAHHDADFKPGEGTLSMQLRQFFPYDERVEDDKLRDAWFQSLHEYTSCEKRLLKKDEQVVPLVLPRMPHALNLFTIPIPARANHVETVKKLPKPGDRQGLTEWLANQPGPMLVKAVVKSVDMEMAGILNFGGIAPSKIKKRKDIGLSYISARQWLTSQELMMMARYSDIQVKAAYRYDQLQAWSRHPMMRRLFSVCSDLDVGSYSMGLFMLNLWTGVVSKWESFPNKDLSVNGSSSFFRAHDRLILFSLAQNLAADGIPVWGYGAGRIHVAARKSEITSGALFQKVVQLGLIPPAIVPAQDQEITLSLPPLPDSLKLFIELMSEGDAENALALDEAIIEEFFAGVEGK